MHIQEQIICSFIYTRSGWALCDLNSLAYK